jgi:hypothetical protein
MEAVAVKRRRLGTSRQRPGAPISDPARFSMVSSTCRVGDRRSEASKARGGVQMCPRRVENHIFLAARPFCGKTVAWIFSTNRSTRGGKRDC